MLVCCERQEKEFMPRGGAHFSSEELVRVLSHYDIGVVHKAQAVSAGNRLAPKIAAVLDFDSVRIAPPIADLANAMLQFSIVGGRPNPAQWPDYFDEHKLIEVLTGYREVVELDKNKLDSLLDLMIETMIAEAVLPVAATGFFGNLSGLDFLKMILRKAKWLEANKETLTRAIDS